MDSDIIIKDSSDSTLYSFGEGFSLVGYPLNETVKQKGRAYQDGSLVTPDKKIQSGLVIIEGMLHQTQTGGKITSSSAFETELVRLLEIRNKEIVHIYMDKSKRFIMCTGLQFSNHRWLPARRAGKVELGFKVIHPYWHLPVPVAPRYSVATAKLLPLGTDKWAE